MYSSEQNLLENAGLNASEAAMFLAILGLKEVVSLKSIIRLCKMTEFTGYRSANRLEDAGLIELYTDNGLKYVKPATMHKLIAHIGKEQRKLRRLELNLKDLADRYALKSDSKKEINVFEGAENFADCYDSIPEQCDDQLLIFGSVNNLWKVTGQDFFSTYEKQWIKRRVKRGTKAYVVERDKSDFQDIIKRDNIELRNTKFIADGSNADSVTFISNSKVYLFETGDALPRVTVVEHDGLVKNITNYHKMLWKAGLESVR